jgi:hypothetical protein
MDNPRPVVLFVDNHGSHTSIDNIEWARERGIFMIGGPPNTTAVTSPLDSDVMAVINSKWRDEKEQ